ncbi:hypothetical protein [Saccharicrinis fermentans]|uniref:Uncharacterized protein n=2 Tax=Saccharicrinis fermentans TaxID=982 RepID=W7YBL1_9BACT|nr:hypothetical protein [Saccharicrinis fermentans]GAF05033.1 hypothetical protein JCM21142_93756 [Saccharicrinis fermentans DSM 9555 = JCM 21142]
MANAWVADLTDKNPTLKIQWDEEKEISEIRLFFDTDYDHAMETVQYGHPEDVIPFCVRNYTIQTLSGDVIKEVKGNYQTIHKIKLENPIRTKQLNIAVEHPSNHVPASIFEVVCR